MKFIFYFLLLSLSLFIFFDNVYLSISVGLTLVIALFVITKSNDSFVFRQWALLLYAVNYLFSPAITYYLESEKIVYSMKIDSNYYFSLALPGFLLFASGLFFFRTSIFKPSFDNISKATYLNEGYLIQLTILGILCSIFLNKVTSSFAFFVYLLSLFRYVGIFALFGSNPFKYRYFGLFFMLFELYGAFKNALFHDVIMWMIFFSLFYIYIKKPSLIFKLIGAFILIMLVLLIQMFKTNYRQRVWYGGEAASFETINDVSRGIASSDVLTGEDNLIGTLNRGNQAWIFASTVENMDRLNDFQGMSNINLYLEASLLPRFLAPNKIISGDKNIFNKFSGHKINEGTSMGLGVFADGYIAYGRWGVYAFTFSLGLLFSLTFKLVERWSRISVFYILFVIPMLIYAVRPDCELQTTINHLTKSIIVFGALVTLTKYRFTLDHIKLYRK